MITVRNILVEYLVDDPKDLKNYMLDAMDLIHGEAQRKNHEFDGYFGTKWRESSKTLNQFNEHYFDDVDRKWLYVYLSAMIDDEILSFLDDAYEVISQTPLSREKIQLEINKLIEKGTRF
ncbi:hypothetical protein [Chryseobacterium oncorhynchi]|uniref:Uncharacterized protein n=1 Tax=Chryseobacterium oncorhynchi TaxID=741074 RepID=A0A316WF71_9FLAO|nr:hypothetical protein [Chryseobacterium oncorhynchi]PWN60027.1 hypothetical protein C1638_020895 [Chryseobacterium oncorhynchi]